MDMFLLIFTNKKNKLILPIIVSYKYSYMYVTIKYLVSYAYLIIKFVIHFPSSDPNCGSYNFHTGIPLKLF